MVDEPAGQVRRPRWKLRADWYGDGTFAHPLSDLTDYAGDITVNHERQRTLPSVGIPEGAGSSSLSTAVAGRRDPTRPDSPTVASAFAPWRTDADLYGHPLIGTPVECDATVDGQGGRLFTGRLSRVEQESRGDAVGLEAIDGSTVMRAPITQQATGMDATLLARYGPDRYNARTNSHWWYDRIFRANGFYASPPPMPNSFISATLHGSTVPEIGGGGVPRRVNVATPSNPQAWVGGNGAAGDHPHKMMYANPEGLSQSGVWTAPTMLTMNPGDGFGVSGLFRMPSTPVSAYMFGALLNGGPIGPKGATAGDYAVIVYFEGGAPSIYIFTPADGLVGGVVQWPRPSRAEWHHFGFHWGFRVPAGVTQITQVNIPVEVVMTIAIDGDNYEPQYRTLNVGNARLNPWAPSTTVEYNMGGGIRFTNISWFKAPVAPTSAEWVGPGHVSQADIDPGMNELTGIPQINGEDSWPLAKEFAAAEAGTLGLSRTMRPYFRSRAVHRPLEAPLELTATHSLGKLAVTTDESSVRNSISATVTPLLVDDYEWVKESKDPLEFESGPGTSYFPVTLPQDTVLVEPWYIYRFGNRATWEAFADHPYFRQSWLYSAIYADAPTVPVPANLVDFGLFPGGPGQCIIVIYNYTGKTVRFATEDQTDEQGNSSRGSAAFKLPGRLLKAQAAQPQNITDPASVAMFGARTHELGGGSTRWHHHDRAITGVAESVLAQTAHPYPALGTVQVLHHADIELDGHVRVHDPDGLGSVRGLVTRQAIQLSSNAAVVDDLGLQAIAPPGFGVLDDYELGQVGVSLRFGA